jgi:spore germination protein GerM
MSPRPPTFLGLPLKTALGTIAFIAIAVAGLTFLERTPPDVDPTADRLSTTPPTTPPKTPLTTPPEAVPSVSAVPSEAPSVAPSAAPSAQSSANPLPSAAPGPATYWVEDRNNRIAFSRQAIGQSKTASQDPETQLRQAIEALLATPQTETTAIPANTRLRSLKLRDRRNIYIDLSQEFVTGGGTASMSARVGQILLTATSLDPTAQVWLSVEGELLRELGGEGIEIPQPLTKTEFETNFGL